MRNEHELHDEDVVLDEEGEAHMEDLELSDEEAFTREKFKALRHKLAVSEKEKGAHLEELQRARADFLNSKRRNEEQLSRDKERILERVITDFLPLLDSFDTALMSSKENTDGDSWRKGVEVMHAQFMNLLKSYEVKEIEALGAPFNPHEHEAVSNVQVENDAQVDTVILVLQKGFKRNDTIIRPAKVVVGIQ